MKYVYTFLLLVLLISCSTDPKKMFEDFTSLRITEEIYDMETTDDYFAFEGEKSIVFETTNKQIRKWISQIPPWGNHKWSRGNVKYPTGRGSHFNFSDGLGIAIDSKGVQSYLRDSNLIKVFTDTSNYYVYEEWCCDSLPFHDGSLLILQSPTNMVYYSHWNF